MLMLNRGAAAPTTMKNTGAKVKKIGTSRITCPEILGFFKDY
jgi:hypothetical protein